MGSPVKMIHFIDEKGASSHVDFEVDEVAVGHSNVDEGASESWYYVSGSKMSDSPCCDFIGSRDSSWSIDMSDAVDPP